MQVFGNFVGDLVLRPLTEGYWIVDKPFGYITAAGDIITVPPEFITDLASVPRIPGIYSVFGNVGHRAAIIHDFLYAGKILDRAAPHKTVTRKFADKVFYEALRTEGFSRIKAYLMYAAVRAFGRRIFNT